MDIKNRGKRVALVLVLLSLTACQQDPDSPMKVVMSDEAMDRYSVQSYQDLYETDKSEYQRVLAYCKAHDKKPNCVNVFAANRRIFRYSDRR